MNLTLAQLDAMSDGPMKRSALAQLRTARMMSNAPTAKTYKGKPAKYRNVRTAGAWGRTYDSKAEATRAAELLAMVEAGHLLEVVTQPYVWLAGIVYRPDFFVVELDGSAHYEDVKGKTVQRTRDVVRLWRANHRLPLVLLRRKGKRWERETIEPTKGRV